MDGACGDLLLQEYCKKLLNLMDIFWCDIKHVHLPFFKFKYDFNAPSYSKCPDFENLYTPLTMIKGSGLVRTSSSFQADQDESAVCDFVTSEREGE